MATKKWQKSYFDVLGLCCSSEVPLIEKILKPLDGVKEISVIVPSRTLIVVHDNLLISQIQIVKALNQARLEANVRIYGEVAYQKKWPSPFAIVSGILLLLSFLKYVYQPFRWLALGAVAAGIFPIAWRGIVAIRNFTLDINILVLIAVIGTIALNDYWEAGSIVFLFTIAEWLESRASHKATAVMSSLMSIAPQKAVIADTGEIVEANSVLVDTIIAVKTGEVIPIDGIVVEGKCEVDEKSLTGESFPVAKQKDSTVWAGTINLNGYISVKTTALAEDCVVAKMAKLVEEAQNSKSKTQRFIDKCTKFYTPVVVLISAGLAGIPAALRVHDLSHWFHLSLVVLVSACPCALILSTPVATFCALSKAAVSGLLIKGGEYLEILAKIRIMAFDKTGTITRGEFVVKDFLSLRDDVSSDTLLYWVSSIESKSSHPMAAALFDYGLSQSVEPKPENVEEFQNFPGEGIHGKIDGKDIYVGNRKIALRAGCETVPTIGEDKEGKTIGYVYSDATPTGIFTLSDTCRTGVVEAIKELKLLGIKSAMLTGDSHASAMHTQDQLGHTLEVVHAELLPEDKARIIKDFKEEGPTAMIGDGVNDAPALATADIGISMGITGSALATETGHVVLMTNDIRKIPKAVRLARKTHRKVVENVILSITTKAAILALAIAGHPLIWAAVLADVGTCLLVIFNSMLLLRGTHQHGGKCCKSSAASHVDKHGCKGGGSHSSHNHQHSCSNSISQKKCEPQKCSSQRCASRCQPDHSGLSSCVNTKCTDSADRHDCCVGNEGHHDMQHCDQRSGNTATHGTELHNKPNHSCSGHSFPSLCVKDEGANLVDRLCDGGGDGFHESKHCKHGGCDMVNHNTISCSTSNHQHHSIVLTDSRQQMPNNGHCQKIPCIKNHVKNHSKDEVGHEVGSECKKHGMDSSAPLHASTDLELGTGLVESTGKHACMSLEKREVGGCCKSFRKECCGKHGHFGAGFGAGLSEIITE